SHLIARSYASAITWAIDPAEQPAVRDALAAYLAETVAPCAAATDELTDDFQSAPERSLVTPLHAGSAASFLFPWYLDEPLGVRGAGTVPIGLLEIGSQKTPPGFEWNNEPDLFDALRGALKAQGTRSVSDLLMDFAVTRLFLGDRSDGAHPVSASWSGS